MKGKRRFVKYEKEKDKQEKTGIRKKNWGEYQMKGRNKKNE